MSQNQEQKGSDKKTNKFNTRGKAKQQYPKKNTKNKDQSERDINRDAPPKDLSGLIGNMQLLDRGNAKVVLDHEFVERAGQDYFEIIASVQRQRDRLDQNGNPQEHAYLANGTIAGLSLATARKLVTATPESQQAVITEFNQIPKFDIKIPSTYVQLCDLLGKSSYNEWNVRIRYNDMFIKKFLAKSLKYASGNQDFLLNYIPNNNGQHNNLVAMRNDDLHNLVFEDATSAQYIIDTVKVRLKELLARNLIFNCFDNNGAPIALNFAIPQFNVDTAGRPEILNWLGLLDANHHADPNDQNFFTNVLACGLLLLINRFWLNDMNALLVNLDNAFANIPALANLTVRGILNAGGFTHIQQYIARADFKSFYESCFTYYSLTIQPRLNNFFRMVNQGIGSFGSPAQLIFLLDEEFIQQNYQNNTGIDRRDIRSGTREAYSYVKMELIDSVVKAAMYGITKSVEVGSDIWITYQRPLVNIRGNHSAKDNILNYGLDRTHNF
jgi:hypothetical protein